MISWHDFAQISLTYSIIIHKHSISSWFKAPSLHVPMYHWNEAADELQNLPSCDGDTDRLFCGRKITGQYKRVKKAQIRAYVHGLWSYEWSIHGHVHFLRKVTSRRQSECFVTFPWFIFSRSNVFASRVWRVREEITGKIPSWLQKFRLPKVWTRSGLKPFPTQFMRGKAIITIINSNFQKMANSHFY